MKRRASAVAIYCLRTIFMNSIGINDFLLISPRLKPSFLILGSVPWTLQTRIVRIVFSENSLNPRLLQYEMNNLWCIHLLIKKMRPCCLFQNRFQIDGPDFCAISFAMEHQIQSLNSLPDDWANFETKIPFEIHNYLLTDKTTLEQL